MLLLLRALLIVTLAGPAAAATCPPTPEPPTPAQLQAARQQDRGLLWKLQRDGRSSWLYGTLHVGKAEWMTPGPRVAAALAGSAVLALEIDPTDRSTQGDLAAADGDTPALPPA
ncbi:MAG: TraB/GumN family protein, partial [Rubrivivax sp.]